MKFRLEYLFESQKLISNFAYQHAEERSTAREDILKECFEEYQRHFKMQESRSPRAKKGKAN